MVYDDFFEDKIDYSKFRISQGIPFKDLINSNNIVNVVSELIRITSTINDERNKLITAYLLTPSAMVESIPILFCYGEPGTGKSAVGVIAGALIGSNPLQGQTSTFAAIRNEINNNRFDNSYQPPREDNFCLILDDITDTLLTETNIFSILKAGCYRKTDKIMISGDRPGTNQIFYCFSPKIISSITPIHQITTYKELHRRMISILFSKSNTPPEVEYNLINFTGLNDLFNNYWQSEINCIKYSKTLKEVNDCIDIIADECKIVSIDKIALMSSVCATALHFKLFKNEISFYTAVYHTWMQCKQSSFLNSLDKIIQDLINKCTINYDNCIHIEHDKLRYALGNLRKKELTDMKMSDLKEILINFGFQLSDYKGKKVWQLDTSKYQEKDDN